MCVQQTSVAGWWLALQTLEQLNTGNCGGGGSVHRDHEKNHEKKEAGGFGTMTAAV